VPGPRLYPLN